MKCPYCSKEVTLVTNSRPTKHSSQIWRRRKCWHCHKLFTTHEIVDLPQLIVIKKSGKHEVFSHVKLFSGIYGATIGYKVENREKLVEKITDEVVKSILKFNKKIITSSQIADIVLAKLRPKHFPVFLKFLAYCKNITSEFQMKKELEKYLS